MPALHQTVDDPRMHILSDRRYIYIYIWVARRRKVRRRRKPFKAQRGENGGAWGGAGEREAMRRRVGREYEMRAGERQLRLYMTSAAGLV